MTILLLSIASGFSWTASVILQAGAVAGGQDRAVLDARYAAKELPHFVWA